MALVGTKFGVGPFGAGLYGFEEVAGVLLGGSAGLVFTDAGAIALTAYAFGASGLLFSAAAAGLSWAWPALAACEAGTWTPSAPCETGTWTPLPPCEAGIWKKAA